MLTKMVYSIDKSLSSTLSWSIVSKQNGDKQHANARRTGMKCTTKLSTRGVLTTKGAPKETCRIFLKLS